MLEPLLSNGQNSDYWLPQNVCWENEYWELVDNWVISPCPAMTKELKKRLQTTKDFTRAEIDSES